MGRTEAMRKLEDYYQLTYSVSATPSKFQLIGCDSQQDKSKAVGKERTYKATFRHKDAPLRFVGSHIGHSGWKTGGL